jgi:hypothetical protein
VSITTGDSLKIEITMTMCLGTSKDKGSQVKTQLVLWIFILFKVTICFGLYHQAIIRSQVNNRFLGMLDTVIHKNESHRFKMQRDLVVVILYGSIYISMKL